MPTPSTFVIVGAGLAGATATETLRAEGFDGRLVLVGAEAERPYERPALSKGYLQGKAGREKLFVHPEGFYAEHGIELLTGTTATSLDAGRREVALDSGERLRFDRLLLATGAAPRRLNLHGAELDGVLYLRDVDDADACRARAARRGGAVVVGAGWIGAEVAASLRESRDERQRLERHGLDPADDPRAGADRSRAPARPRRPARGDRQGADRPRPARRQDGPRAGSRVHAAHAHRALQEGGHDPRHRGRAGARAASSRSTARGPRSTATTTASCTPSRPSARTWVASSGSTAPSARGTARATAPASASTAGSSTARPSGASRSGSSTSRPRRPRTDRREVRTAGATTPTVT